MPKRINARIETKPEFREFIEKSLRDDRLVELIAENPLAALRKAGLRRADIAIEPRELENFYKVLVALRQEAREETQKPIAYADVFDAIFGDVVKRDGERIAVKLELDGDTRIEGHPVAVLVEGTEVSMKDYASLVANEDRGCHTGYNEGWSNSSGRTATTDCGTHRIFRYDLTKGRLLDPAEAMILSSRLVELVSQIGTHPLEQRSH